MPGGWLGWDGRLGSRIAPAGTRIGAKAIDVLIIVLIQFVVGLGAAAVLLSSGSIDPFANEVTPFGGANLGLTVSVAMIGLVIDFVYNVVIVARFGGQPGKLMLGLRIVDTDGNPPGMGVAFRRWSPMLIILVLGAIPLISLLGSLARFILAVANLVMILADDQRRDVFDHVGGTFVVTRR